MNSHDGLEDEELEQIKCAYDASFVCYTSSLTCLVQALPGLYDDRFAEACLFMISVILILT
jgi:hypothetical protein